MSDMYRLRVSVTIYHPDGLTEKIETLPRTGKLLILGKGDTDMLRQILMAGQGNADDAADREAKP